MGVTVTGAVPVQTTLSKGQLEGKGSQGPISGAVAMF